MNRSKGIVCIICCVVLALSMLLCSCAYGESRDIGSYVTEKRLCWIKYDTHYENGKPVNIAELYVTEFSGKGYSSTVYSLNEVFDYERENYKILQSPFSEDSGALYIANYGGREIDIVKFTVSDGFSDEIYHCSLPQDICDGMMLDEVGEVFAFANEFVYFTAFNAADSLYEVSICRYNTVKNINEIMTACTVSKSYYSAPVLSDSGDILFIAESLAPAAENRDADSSSARKTHLYMLSQGRVEYIAEARLAVWKDDGCGIIYQPLDTQYMLYDTESGESSVYVAETLGRSSFCDSFAVSGNDIAYWAQQSDLYIRDGIFTWTQMVPDGVKLVLMNKETGEELIIIGCDTFNQFDYVDCSRLVWLEAQSDSE